MTLPRIEDHGLLADRVFDAIRASIVNGDLAAGERLRIRDLAAQVGTSVMPVREAIRRLEEAGLARSVPHKGAVVRGLTLEELVHTYDVRTLLEVEAARLGAGAADDPVEEHLRAEYELMRTAIAEGHAQGVVDHDEALLSHLYRAAGNPVLVEQVSALWQRCRSYKIVGAAATLQTSDPSALWTFQEQLLDAVKDRDAERAAAITAASLRDATARIREQLAGERPTTS